MSTVRVKICGMTRSEDILAASTAGADMLGFVFASSPRQLSLESAVDLLSEVPDGILRVGLFMNSGAGSVNEVLESVSLDLLQFHGNEDRLFCGSFGVPYVKAIAMGNTRSPVDAAALYPDAAGHLYDSHAPGEAGGTGNTFDWSLLRKGTHPVWLAGGLTPGNVASAVKQVRPWAVDVSSGVEESPGRKSYELVKAFIRAAKSIDMDEHNCDEYGNDRK